LLKEVIDMKRDMIDILCCPTCKGDLELKVEKEDNSDDCPKCRRRLNGST